MSIWHDRGSNGTRHPASHSHLIVRRLIDIGSPSSILDRLLQRRLRGLQKFTGKGVENLIADEQRGMLQHFPHLLLEFRSAQATFGGSALNRRDRRLDTA